MTTKLAKSYKRHKVHENYDAIVVGSGIGGLAAAALLSKHAGKRVLVLERHYAVGGYTQIFRRPGYDWDVGVHYIGDVAPGSSLRAVFDDVSDGQIEWADLGDVYDRIIIDSDTYDLPKGRKELRSFLMSQFPGEESAIDAYFAAIRSAVASSMPFHATKTLPDAIGAAVGPLARRRFLGWSDRTTREVLEGFTSNQRLIAVLTGQCGDYGLPPAESSFMIHAMVANHYFQGAYYPVGGSGKIAGSIVPVIERAGGSVLINAEVAEVLVENGHAVGVRMAEDDALIHAPIVISDAGVINTFTRLLPNEVADQYGLLEDLKSVGPSMGHLCLYVGFKHTAEELQLPKHNLWIYPSQDYEAAFEESRKDPDAELPVVYVSFPAAKDPDFLNRHPGRATIDIITAAPHQWFEQWTDSRWKKRPDEYEQLKEELAQRMLAKVYEQLPQLRGKVDVYELSTPLTTEHFSNYQKGEIYGLDHTPQRFRQQFLKPATPIKGLYLTGQDIVSCGVAGALMGGVLTAAKISSFRLLPGIIKAAASKASMSVHSGR
jgi:all-trans-retinol 13,14-reductase